VLAARSAFENFDPTSNRRERSATVRERRDGRALAKTVLKTLNRFGEQLALPVCSTFSCSDFSAGRFGLESNNSPRRTAQPPPHSAA